jgi:hypothetical protein
MPRFFLLARGKKIGAAGDLAGVEVTIVSQSEHAVIAFAAIRPIRLLIPTVSSRAQLPAGATA